MVARVSGSALPNAMWRATSAGTCFFQEGCLASRERVSTISTTERRNPASNPESTAEGASFVGRARGNDSRRLAGQASEQWQHRLPRTDSCEELGIGRLDHLDRLPRKTGTSSCRRQLEGP